MALAGGIGVIHRNLTPEQQAREVERVKRFVSGMVVDPLTIAPDAQLKDALKLMSEQPDLGRARGRAEVRQAGRHPDQPRRALRDQHGNPGRRTDDPGQADHRQGRRQAVRGQAAAAPQPHREAARRRQRLPLRRPDHGQGHREGREEPQRGDRRAGPVARRGGDHRRRGRLRAHRAADRGGLRPDRRRHRARAFQARAGGGDAHQEAVELDPGDRRQRRHAPRRRAR